ncbi:MAG TPA: NAD-dependent epimerase/dehydratase family protein [Symbiobacteriaceae bacterium]
MAAFAGIARLNSIDVCRAYNLCSRLEPGYPDPVPLSEDAPLREKLYPYRGDAPRSEDDPDRWMDDYDKILAERIFMEHPEIPGTILRLPMVYGPGDRQHRLFKYIKRMDDNRPAILLQESVARWRGSRGYVEDVAAAIAFAASDQRASGRIYNVGELEAHYEADWVQRIAKVAGWAGRVVSVPDACIPAHLHVPWDLNQHWRGHQQNARGIRRH